MNPLPPGTVSVSELVLRAQSAFLDEPDSAEAYDLLLEALVKRSAARAGCLVDLRPEGGSARVVSGPPDLVAPSEIEGAVHQLVATPDRVWAGRSGLHLVPLSHSGDLRGVLCLADPRALDIDDTDVALLLQTTARLLRVHGNRRHSDRAKTILRRAQEGGRMGIWQVELPSGALSWSEGTYEVMGVDPAHFTPTIAGYLNLIHPEDRATVAALWERARVTREDLDEEVFHRTVHPRTGEVRHILLRGRVGTEGTGRGIWVAGVVQDLTEEREAEARLREFRAAMEQSMDGMALADLDGTLLTVNEACAAMHGWAVAELEGKHLGIFHTPEQMDDEVTRGLDALAIDGTWSGTVEHLHRDGRTFPVRLQTTVVRDARGTPVRLFAVMRDLTEEQVANEAVAEAFTRLERIAEHVPGVIYQYRLRPDGSSHFPYASSGIGEIYGVEPHQVVDDATPVFEVLHPDDIARVSAEIARSAEALEEWHSQYRVRFTDGRVIWVEGHASPEREADGGILWHGYIRDISDRIAAEREHEHLQSQLHQVQKLESVGRLAGGVAHDFNNMLTVIQGHVEMALEGLAPDDPHVATFTAIAEAAERSANITRQLLGFARRQPASPTALDMTGAIDGALGLLRRLIGEDIELDWVPGPDALSIEMDPSQLDQVVTNLCVNARDAVSSGGRIVVSTGREAVRNGCRPDDPEVRAGDYAVLRVSDDGHGMDAETLTHIFDPFYTTKPTGRGTGLGLSTVHGIVKQNDGFIEVESTPGVGTTFSVYLPLHRAGGEVGAAT